MSHDIDELLREDGEHWRASLPALGDPDIMLGNPLTRRPHRALAIARVAAVVVAVAGVAVAVRLTAASPHRDQPNPAGPIPQAVRCQDAFHAGPSKLVVGKFRQELRVTLTYEGSAPCRVSVYGPYVELRDAANNLVGTGAHATLEARVPDFLEVVGGDVLAITMGPWLVYSCEGPVPHVVTAVLHMGGIGERSGRGVLVGVANVKNPRPCEHGYREAQAGIGVDSPTLLHGPNQYPASYGSVPPNAAELPTSETQTSGTPRHLDWSLVAIDKGGRRITITFLTGVCDRLDHVAVESTGYTVTLTPIVRTNGGVCNAIGILTTGYITLPGPLGRRALLHPPK